MKIKLKDTIIVNVGKDHGRQGVVAKILPQDNTVIIEGLNQYKKHVKPSQGRKGEIVTISRPLDVSKVALVCPKCKQPTRVGYRFVEGKKLRVCRKCNTDI
ncbi:MAG: 50S ribosomal protein L24 [Candidatus Amesbacteria bacterium]|nr:50S ribosomal protein L24 [Candidatus Amesbacteria bacterium]